MSPRASGRNAFFVISTTSVKRTKTATITASYNSSFLSSTLTVTG